MDEVEIDPGVRVGIPVQPRGAIGDIATMDVLLIEVQVGDGGGDLPGPTQQPAMAVLRKGQHTIKHSQVPVVGVMLTCQEEAGLGIIAVEERIGFINPIHLVCGVFSLQRE